MLAVLFWLLLAQAGLRALQVACQGRVYSQNIGGQLNSKVGKYSTETVSVIVQRVSTIMYIGYLLSYTYSPPSAMLIEVRQYAVSPRLEIYPGCNGQWQGSWLTYVKY